LITPGNDSLLIIACKMRDLKMAAVLLASGADLSLNPDALCVAVRTYNSDLVDLLLNAGADLMFDDYQIVIFSSFFFRFCLKDELVVRLLKAGANVSLLARCMPV